MVYHDKMRGLTAAAALATGLGVMAAAPAMASTMTINFESGYTDNQELFDGDILLDSAGNPTNVSIMTVNDNTMSVEASGDSGASDADDPPDGFVNDPLGGGFDDTESAVATSSLGGFFLRTTESLSLDPSGINPIFSLLFGGKGAAIVSAEIWDIDGTSDSNTEQWTLNAFDSGGTELGQIISPEGTNTADATSLNGQPWAFTFSNIGAISRVDFNFTGTKTSGIGVAFDNLNVSPVPLPAAGWLMVAGLGGLAALRRRKRAA